MTTPMTKMAARSMRLAMGCAAAGVVAVAAASGGAPATAATGKVRGGLIVQSINVAGAADVAANQIVEVTFSAPVDPASVNPSTLPVYGRNATDKGYTKAVFGSLQVVGNVVRFYPRLPTHLRDPKTGNFYPTTDKNDDAGANAGFQPSTKYAVVAIGRPAVTTIRSTTGKPLRRGVYTTFQIASAAQADELWTSKTYSDSGDPEFSFSNPPDTAALLSTQFMTHGGTQDVPSNLMVSLFCTKIPLAPATTRITGNVTMTMLARKNDYTLRRPVSGTPFVEQNFDTTLLAFQPRVALADLATYGLRVTKGVKDLTEEKDFGANRARTRLRLVYDQLYAGRAAAPSEPIATLPIDPDLIPDWPDDVIARGILKENLLDLGDKYPDEIDPRMMVIFTTRDEPSTPGLVSVEFTKNEGLYDSAFSTGTVDTDVPGAAAGIFTAAAGTLALGDLTPTVNKTISADSYPLAELNYRNIVIPQGVAITFTGTRPATVKCLSIQLNGELRADGTAGTDVPTSANYSYTISQNSTSPVPGGPGGPGGGAGGISNNTFTSGTAGGTGVAGNDSNGSVATAQQGGRGGTGGKTSVPTTSPGYYSFGGGGGGGGSRVAGTNGAPGGNNQSPYASWNGAGGSGGAGALANDSLNPVIGGAGGGAGGVGGYFYYSWGVAGGSGGGGGGAIIVQTATSLTIGSNGAIRARGGKGGQGSGIKSTWSSGAGGGGGGGSILLRSTKNFSIVNPSNSLDVSGGPGGTQSGTYTSPYGGNGGAGFIRLESPNGGLTVPGGTAGTFQPIGAGSPSVVYTKWLDLGVQDPRVLPWTSTDIVTDTTNDAIYVQAQMTKEHPTKFGNPDTGSILITDQSSTNVNITSQWTPIKVHDKTGLAGGAFTPTLGPIPGLPTIGVVDEYTGFNISALNGKGYRFIRFRIYFQLDATQTTSSSVPSVDRIVTNFIFNF